MDREKDSLLLHNTYTTSISTVELLLHLQYYQRCELMILKMRVKSNFFCDNHVIITYSLERRIRKFTFSKYSFFRKRAVTVNLKKLISNSILR